jgi:uncharacterized membrane protein HdeD (DUF308 family)
MVDAAISTRRCYGVRVDLEQEMRRGPEFVMAGGILLIVAGILIALYPPLLSLIVASLLILVGIGVITIAHYNKKLRKHYDNPAVDFFFRF